MSSKKQKRSEDASTLNDDDTRRSCLLNIELTEDGQYTATLVPVSVFPMAVPELNAELEKTRKARRVYMKDTHLPAREKPRMPLSKQDEEIYMELDDLIYFLCQTHGTEIEADSGFITPAGDRIDVTRVCPWEG